METRMKVAKKRDRSENWLSEDKHLLTKLVRQRVSAIENKNTDTNTNVKKQAAWEDLLNSFNCMCKGTKRTIRQLKSQWGIIKMHEKKLKCAKRRQIIATGGGPPPPSLQDPANTEDISAWLPSDFVIDKNEFDSDQINQVKVGGLSPHEIILEVNEEDRTTQEVLPLSNERKEVNKITKDNENKVVSHLTNQLRKKKTGKKENENKISTSAVKAIARVEIDCRKELHYIQMENETKKSRNLDLEEELLKKKIEYYERKSKML